MLSNEHEPLRQVTSTRPSLPRSKSHEGSESFVSCTGQHERMPRAVSLNGRPRRERAPRTTSRGSVMTKPPRLQEMERVTRRRAPRRGSGRSLGNEAGSHEQVHAPAGPRAPIPLDARQRHPQDACSRCSSGPSSPAPTNRHRALQKGRATYCQAGELGPTLSGVRRSPRGATTTRTIEIAYCPATAAAAKRAEKNPSLSRAREPRRAAPLLVGFAAKLDAITSALSRSVPRCPSPSSSSSSSSGSTVRGQELGLAPRSRVQPVEPGPHRPLRNLLRPFLWAVANPRCRSHSSASRSTSRHTVSDR